MFCAEASCEIRSVIEAEEECLVAQPILMIMLIWIVCVHFTVQFFWITASFS